MARTGVCGWTRAAFVDTGRPCQARAGRHDLRRRHEAHLCSGISPTAGHAQRPAARSTALPSPSQAPAELWQQDYVRASATRGQDRQEPFGDVHHDPGAPPLTAWIRHGLWRRVRPSELRRLLAFPVLRRREAAPARASTMTRSGPRRGVRSLLLPTSGRCRRGGSGRGVRRAARNRASPPGRPA